MRYRIVALGLCLLAAALAGCAQERKEHRIGWLLSVPSSSAPTLKGVAVFAETLRGLGYVEGRNLVVVYRYADEGPAQLPALAADLVSQKLDVIVSDGSDSTRALQRATTTIPIVMAVSASPVEQGFVASFARPGGNITGLSMLITELARKRLEMLKELVPNASRVTALGTDRGALLQFRDTKLAAQLLGIELQVLDVPLARPEYERQFAAAAAAKADALIVLPEAIFARDRAQIIELAAKQRLPTMYFERMFTESGGLASYGPDIGEMFRRSAIFVDKILKGAKPADLPVEQVDKFDLVINLQTAKALDLPIPQALRMRADKVID